MAEVYRTGWLGECVLKLCCRLSRGPSALIRGQGIIRPVRRDDLVDLSVHVQALLFVPPTKSFEGLPERLDVHGFVAIVSHHRNFIAEPPLVPVDHRGHEERLEVLVADTDKPYQLPPEDLQLAALGKWHLIHIGKTHAATHVVAVEMALEHLVVCVLQRLVQGLGPCEFLGCPGRWGSQCPDGLPDLVAAAVFKHIGK